MRQFFQFKFSKIVPGGTAASHTCRVWGAVIFWEAEVRERNGKRQEAANIRGWVADLLSEQSKVVRSVWRSLPKPNPTTLM